MNERVIISEKIFRCESGGKTPKLKELFGNSVISPSPELSLDAGKGDLLLARYTGSEPEFSILCRRGTVLCSYYERLQKTGMSPLFSPACLEETEQILSDPGTDDPALADYRSIPFVTVDNDGSRDLDQALYVEKNGSGYRIYYALADASYYVRPGMALFDRALDRGASFYFPQFSVPMLPPELSEGIISLNPDRERRSLLFITEIDSSGIAVKTEVVRALIRSRAKLSYSGVQKFYDSPGNSVLSGCEYSESLVCLQEAGRILRRAMMERGVVAYDRHELQVSIDETGGRLIFGDEERNDASRWNEQMSLLCNMEGARIINSSEGTDAAQPVFRVHDSPGGASLGRLKKVIDGIISIQGLDRKEWAWQEGEGETLADYLEKIKNNGYGPEIALAIERQILVTNEKSLFSSEPSPHYALRAGLYGRFSSPMREIVGIYTHKELLEKLGFEEPLPEEEDLQIRERVIDAGNRSKEIQKGIERMVRGMVLDSLFSGDLELPFGERPVRYGTVLGMKESRMYMMLSSPALEVKVYREDIEDAAGCSMSLDSSGLSYNSDKGLSLAAGSAAGVRVRELDGRGKWRLVPVLPLPGSGA